MMYKIIYSDMSRNAFTTRVSKMNTTSEIGPCHDDESFKRNISQNVAANYMRHLHKKYKEHND